MLILVTHMLDVRFFKKFERDMIWSRQYKIY